MQAMDDTLADESGIPFLTSTEDIPVHSTPIKGTKVPLPSTKNVIKNLMSKPGRQDDYTDGESLQSIRHSDLHPRVKGQHSATKGRGQNMKQAEEQNFITSKNNQYRNDVKYSDGNIQDLSNIDNLRQKSSYPGQRAFHTERSRSHVEDHRERVSEQDGVFKRPKDVRLFSVEDEKRILMGMSENDEKASEYKNRTKEQQILMEDDLSTRNKTSNAFSSHANRTKYSSDEHQARMSGNSNKSTEIRERDKQFISSRTVGNTERDLGTKQTSTKVETSVRTDEETRDNRSERKRFSMGSPRNSSNYSVSHSRTLSSSSKQNTSLSELENTTLQKQRQEIQLLMTELRDRDRELSDMMTSHQQQLVAWQQDRDRLASLERKCTQYEEELRMKASQLRNAITNLKSMKSTEIEHKKNLEKFQSTVDRLNLEKNQYTEELSQLQGLNESLQGNIKDLSNKVGRLEAREEELTTSLRLKEKDISSATGHMKELSERLQQLDLRCKEAQDREREALKGKQEWKQKYENSRDEFNALSAEMDHRRKEVVRLAEENKSARQQLALIQKEASMMERCKDELIDSMRVKQERTDTQLRNLRELYDRQVREIASLQMQLDNSKELIYRQQNSIDEQQMSGSYQGRLSQASEFSFERSSVSQRHSGRNKSSPTHSSKYREPEMTGSHQQTQSSGYQSQLYENQTGNQPVSNVYENNFIDLTGSKHSSGPYQSFNGERPVQKSKTENQSGSKPSDSQKPVIASDRKQKLKSDSETKVNKANLVMDLPDKRDAARELIIQTNHSVPSHFENTAKVTQTPSKTLNPVFSSPKRQDGYVIQETTIEIDLCIDNINPDPQKPSGYCESLSENALKSMERVENALSEIQKVPSRTDSVKEQSDVNSESSKGANNSDSELNLCDSFLCTKLDENFNSEQQAYCDIEFEKKYTFDNKLCSFLEDLEDIDDSIWDEKPTKSANVSTTESSPASKLRKLLIESQQMIQSLERSAESPRQMKSKESIEQTDREASVPAEDSLQQASNQFS